ncbi:MAG: PhzF family phenazine biosynthesis protein [Paracoccaceae bacterium]
MDYAVYDVFTDTAFGGNPLAVVFDGSGLTTEQMFQITREFNFSETTFVLPPEDAMHTAKVRIFTPGVELAFAGHPTVGTAIALAERNGAGPEMMLELGVGPIPVSVADGAARFVTTVPLSTSPAPDLAALASSLSIEAADIRTDRHAPITAGHGNDFVLVELMDTQALCRASANVQAFRDTAGADADRLAIFIYCRGGANIDARMFQPLGGIPEDPATGSAAVALAGYLGQLDATSQSFEITQGVDMGRPSLINAEVTVDGGTPTSVAIKGQAVKVMEGRLSLGDGLA